VRRLIEQVRGQQTLTRFFAMGHSYGAISSHWLSLRLPDQLAGAIHSATQSIAGGGPFTGYAKSIDLFPHEQVRVPFVYLHHRDDLCRFTPYRFAQRHGSPNRLITVVGGSRSCCLVPPNAKSAGQKSNPPAVAIALSLAAASSSLPPSWLTRWRSLVDSPDSWLQS
jgi:pimeloyl-ACP methyl ester carboxylesterase